MIILFAIIAYILCAILCGAIVQYCDRDIGISTDDDLMRAICILWPASLLISICIVVTNTCVDISRAIGNWLYTKFHKNT